MKHPQHNHLRSYYKQFNFTKCVLAIKFCVFKFWGNVNINNANYRSNFGGNVDINCGQKQNICGRGIIGTLKFRF